MAERFNLLIVGGGLVGASLALALAPLPLRIAVIEAFPPRSRSQPSYDERATAVSLGSMRILEAIGVWQQVAAAVAPIRHIHVSDRGRFGFTRIAAEDLGVEALGYVVENRHLGHALWDSLASCDGPELICPGRVVGAERRPDAVAVDVLHRDSQHRRCMADLLVAADGVRSTVRAQLGIAASHRPYGQSAIIANLTPQRFHDHVAYERFTDSGPLAVLPLADGRCSIVLTVSEEEADASMALTDAEFLDLVQRRFGYRLGRLLRVGRRHGYPLGLTTVEAAASERVLLLGNAAHGIHPVAGQGFNLGLRDVAVLAEELAEETARAGSPMDPGRDALLRRYRRARRADQQRVIGMTDGLVKLFSAESVALRGARNLGLLLLDSLPPAKNAFAQQAMGTAGRLTRLGRGLPLS